MGAPELIMFDEPSLGLAPAIIHDVLNTIRELNRAGITCLLVEQNVAQSLKLASRAYVLENGRVTLSGSGTEYWPTTASAPPIWGFKVVQAMRRKRSIRTPSAATRARSGAIGKAWRSRL